MSYDREVKVLVTPRNLKTAVTTRELTTQVTPRSFLVPGRSSTVHTANDTNSVSGSGGAGWTYWDDQLVFDEITGTFADQPGDY